MSERNWTAKACKCGCNAWYINGTAFHEADMTKSDALLVAAAPKLLAALKGLFGPCGPQATSERMEAAYAAIAEAEENTA